MSYFLLKIEQFQFPSFHRAWHQKGGRDRAVPYLKNDSSGDFQHCNQFKFEEKYWSEQSNIHKGKQTFFLAKIELQMFFSYFRPPHWCPSEGHQHGVSILSSINLFGTFCQITRVRNTAQIWHLNRFLVYLSSITCQFLAKTQENSSHRVIFFYYIDESIFRHILPTVCTNNRENAPNDVINILTSEDMENMPLWSRMQFRRIWILRVVYFLV